MIRASSLAVLFALSCALSPLASASNVTAADLVEYCGVTETDPESHTAIAFCYGYIDAALDYHHAITADGEGRIACPPGTVSRQEVAVAFVEWAEINTDEINDDPPVHVVMRAVEAKWPCE